MSEYDETDFRLQSQSLCGKIAFLLGWRPHEFWQATPAELSAILHYGYASEHSHSEPIDRQTLDDLIKSEKLKT